MTLIAFFDCQGSRLGLQPHLPTKNNNHEPILPQSPAATEKTHQAQIHQYSTRLYPPPGQCQTTRRSIKARSHL